MVNFFTKFFLRSRYKIYGGNAKNYSNKIERGIKIHFLLGFPFNSRNL